MPVRPTIQIGNPALKAKNQPLRYGDSVKIEQLITDLRDTMRQNELIGIAAPQIAENYKIFVTEPRETKTRSKDQSDEFRVYINPMIVDSSPEEVVIFEGCGSVLNGQLFGPVQRPKQITIEALDENGKRFRLTCDGILARVIQHEYDHLQGVEFLEKVSDYKQMMTADYYVEKIKSKPDHLAACHISIIKHEFIKGNV